MRKFASTLMAFSLISSLLLGCSSKEDSAEMKAEEPAVPAQMEESTEKVTYDYEIGDKNTADTQIILKSSLDQDILSFSLKTVEEDEFSENLLKEDSKVKNNQTILWYAEQPEDSNLGENELNGSYVILLHVKDDSGEYDLYLHNVQPDGIDSESEVTIHEKDGIAYLTYFSSEGEDINTYESELAYKEAEELEEYNQYDSPEDTWYPDETITGSSSNQNPVYYEPVYQEPVYTEPNDNSSAEAPSTGSGTVEGCGTDGIDLNTYND